MRGGVASNLSARWRCAAKPTTLPRKQLDVQPLAAQSHSQFRSLSTKSICSHCSSTRWYPRSRASRLAMSVPAGKHTPESALVEPDNLRPAIAVNPVDDRKCHPRNMSPLYNTLTAARHGLDMLLSLDWHSIKDPMPKTKSSPAMSLVLKARACFRRRRPCFHTSQATQQRAPTKLVPYAACRCCKAVAAIGGIGRWAQLDVNVSSRVPRSSAAMLQH
mmetsp:Transcript_2657/g.4596  ORF Transcript_2657/g.4596 Transcript_2657/m.4596 type:complete len:218 (+) Transcript_2657:626-1279(+)